MQCGIRLASVRARIPAECGIRSQPVWLPVRCSAVTSVRDELALGGSQTCNIGVTNVYSSMNAITENVYSFIFTELLEKFDS